MISRSSHTILANLLTTNPLPMMRRARLLPATVLLRLTSNAEFALGHENHNAACQQSIQSRSFPIYARIPKPVWQFHRVFPETETFVPTPIVTSEGARSDVGQGQTRASDRGTPFSLGSSQLLMREALSRPREPGNGRQWGNECDQGCP